VGEQRASGTATVMFTDVESSTDITTRLGDDAAASLLATHNTIVLDQVAAFGGHDVRSTGDGFLVVFDSARAAVSCALAIQRGLTEREHPIRVRIGLNAGEVLHRGDELFGAAINLAARVMDRADGGEILTTDTVRQLVGTMSDASFRDRGRVTLKGFAERQRLYEVRAAEPDPEPALPPAPRRSRRGSRRRWALAGAAVLAAAVVAAVALLDGSGASDAVAVAPNSVAVIDPGKGAVVATIPVDENPGPISAGAGGVWVLNQNSATLSHIDVKTRTLVDTRGIGGSTSGGGVPGSVAASAQDVWLNAAGCNGGQTGAVLHVVTAGEGGRNLAGTDDVQMAGVVPDHPPVSTTLSGGCGIVAEGPSVWAATNGPDGIVRIDYDPVAGASQVTWAKPLPAPFALAIGGGALWGIDPVDEAAMRIDPGTGRRLTTIDAGSDPVSVAFGADAVWVANAGDNSVSRIDPDTNLVTDTIRAGPSPASIATGAGAVWVALADAGAVARIDPRTKRVTATIPVGHRPQGVVVAGGLVWVAVRA
jgi:YVTN family beta-propeller protein